MDPQNTQYDTPGNILTRLSSTWLLFFVAGGLVLLLFGFFLISVVLSNLNKTSVEILSTPSSAEVYINNAEVAEGKTPLVLRGIEKGSSLKVVVKKEGFFDASTEQAINQSPKHTISIALTEESKVTKTIPEHNQKDVGVDEKIAVTFSPKIPDEQLVFIFNHPVTGVVQKDPPTNTVTFTPDKPLEEKTFYKVSLVGQKGGVNSNIITWSFLSKQVFGEEAFGPAEIDQLKKVRDAAIKAYQDRKARIPFLTKLPYQETNFKIEILSDDTIVITTLSAGTTNETAKEAALNWIRANGGKIEALKITYKTAG